MMQVKLEELVNIKEIRDKVRKELGLSESYVVQAPPAKVKTELLSLKSIGIMNDMVEMYAKELNFVSAELDTAQRDLAMPDASLFVVLKEQEGRLLQPSYNQHCRSAIFIDDGFFNISKARKRLGYV